MAKKKIHVYNDPVLHRKARPVTQISGTIRKLIDDMFETMYANGGIGLAAPQVGVSKRIFVVDTKAIGEKLAMINPRIVSMSRKDLEPYTEGCLSLPGIEAEILRPRKIMVEYLDPEGKERKLTAEGLLARVIQHENDHLDGILLVDRVESKEKKNQLMHEMDNLEAGVYA